MVLQSNGVCYLNYERLVFRFLFAKFVSFILKRHVVYYRCGIASIYDVFDQIVAC